MVPVAAFQQQQNEQDLTEPNKIFKFPDGFEKSRFNFKITL